MTDTISATTPPKVYTFLSAATTAGLTITRPAPSQWVISSPNPTDTWQLFFTHTAGRNGGSLDIRRYTPDAPARRQTTKMTRVQAHAAITVMADSLAAHRDREANAVAPTVTAEAATVASRLNRAGRVALRLVREAGPRSGKLSPATHSKIRGAFRRRGLVDADNALTDLGRAVRQLVTP